MAASKRISCAGKLPAHVYTKMIALCSGFQLRHIPYKSVGPVLMAVVSDQTDLMTVTAATGLSQIKRAGRAGEARIQTSRRRSQLL